MDEQTKKTIDDFSSFLVTNVKKNKSLKHLNINVGNWHCNGFRVTFDIYIHQTLEKIDFDLREIRENKGHFEHLINYAVQTILEKSVMREDR